MTNFADGIQAVAGLVRELRTAVNSDNISVTVRISPDGTEVTVEPWEPYESDIEKVLKHLQRGVDSE